MQTQRKAVDVQPDAEFESVSMLGLNDLLQWAAFRGLSYGAERSVRIQAGTFETRRGLFSFSLSEIGNNAGAEVCAICRAMHVPEHLLQSIIRFFSAASFVHFGFECAGTLKVGKCYLELPPPDPGTTLASGRLQFLGFKWSMNDTSMAVVSRYRSLLISRWDDAASLMLENTGAAFKPTLDNLLCVVDASQTLGGVSTSILEIEDEGSNRRSYDLNVYDCNILLCELADAVQQAALTLNLNEESVKTWLASNAGSSVGHLATGLGRDDASFLTIYHGLLRHR